MAAHFTNFYFLIIQIVFAALGCAHVHICTLRILNLKTISLIKSKNGKAYAFCFGMRRASCLCIIIHTARVAPIPK
jgi:hypothetical protein